MPVNFLLCVHPAPNPKIRTEKTERALPSLTSFVDITSSQIAARLPSWPATKTLLFYMNTGYALEYSSLSLCAGLFSQYFQTILFNYIYNPTPAPYFLGGGVGLSSLSLKQGLNIAVSVKSMFTMMP